jgi:hypothetical protein
MSNRTNTNNINKAPRSKKSGTDEARGNDTEIGELESFVLDLHADAKCGRAGAEYNLAEAYVIDVAAGHVPGHLRDDDVCFERSEWKLTEWGQCVSTALLTTIILRDPPLEIALWDAPQRSPRCCRLL